MLFPKWTERVSGGRSRDMYLDDTNGHAWVLLPLVLLELAWKNHWFCEKNTQIDIPAFKS